MTFAPFRIRPARTSGITSPPGEIVAQAIEDNGGGLAEYLEKLTKMVPAEVVGLYLIGSGVIPTDRHASLLAWTAFCFSAVIIVRALGTRDSNSGQPQWAAVVISAVSFLIWVYSVGGPFPWYLKDAYQPFVGSLLVLAWTFIVPLLYRPSE